jgi:hypothetical protein
VRRIEARKITGAKSPFLLAILPLCFLVAMQERALFIFPSE